MNQTLSHSWKWWKKISQLAVLFQAKIILAILYYIFLLPLGLWYKFTHDTFQTKKTETNWSRWPHPDVFKEINKS